MAMGVSSSVMRRAARHRRRRAARPAMQASLAALRSFSLLALPLKQHTARIRHAVGRARVF